MTAASLLCVLLLPVVARAFSGGWASSVCTGSGQAGVFLGNRARGCVGSNAPGSTSSVSRRVEVSSWQYRAERPRQLRSQMDDYEMFFNTSSKEGALFIRQLTSEERAKRAIEGEELEDEIIAIATVLAEKADAMVAKTGAIDSEVTQPIMDKISVLKDKYKLAVGAVQPGASTAAGPDGDAKGEKSDSP